MLSIRPLSAIAVLLVAATACAQPFAGEAIAIANDKKGIGFDDLRYSRSLHRVLIPAARTGMIVLIDPYNHRTVSINGLSTQGEGTTSVNEGEGALYAIDRTSQQVVIIDPAARRVVARATLASAPDYVRYVAARRELWVTQPDAERIEIFGISPNRDRLTQVAFISVPGGPESLVIDPAGGRAFTHLWSGTTLAINLRSRGIVAKFGVAANGAHCVVTDGKDAYVCDPRRGRILVVHDSYPAAKE